MINNSNPLSIEVLGEQSTQLFNFWVFAKVFITSPDWISIKFFIALMRIFCSSKWIKSNNLTGLEFPILNIWSGAELFIHDSKVNPLKIEIDLQMKQFSDMKKDKIDYPKIILATGNLVKI